VSDCQQKFRPTARRRPWGVSKPVWGLIIRCLDPEPSGRPSAAECACVLAPRRHRSWLKWVAVVTFAVALGAGVWAAAHTLTPPVEIIPTDPYEKGVYFHDRTEYGLAAMAFADSAERRRSGHHYACAAYCSARAKQDDAAIHYAVEAIAYGHTDPSIRLLLAHCHKQIGRIPQARANLAAAATGLPDHPCVLHLRVVLEVDDANAIPRPLNRRLIEEVRSALVGQPDAPAEVWLTLATVYVKLDNRRPADDDAAIDLLRRGVQNGLSRERIERTHSVSTALSSHPRYESALTERIVRDQSHRHPCLISPIPSSN
jgi:hypothetical protein